MSFNFFHDSGLIMMNIHFHIPLQRDAGLEGAAQSGCGWVPTPDASGVLAVGVLLTAPVYIIGLISH